MLISSLKLICLLIEIFHGIENTYAKFRDYRDIGGLNRDRTDDKIIGRLNRYNQINRIVGGKRAKLGIEIQITNQSDLQFPKMNTVPIVNNACVIGDHFERAKPVLPVLWFGNILLKSFRSFQRGTVSLCQPKGCKVATQKTLMMIPFSCYITRATLVQ